MLELRQHFRLQLIAQFHGNFGNHFFVETFVAQLRAVAYSGMPDYSDRIALCSARGK
jgi:hypothetical protein